MGVADDHLFSFRSVRAVKENNCQEPGEEMSVEFQIFREYPGWKWRKCDMQINGLVHLTQLERCNAQTTLVGSNQLETRTRL